MLLVILINTVSFKVIPSLIPVHLILHATFHSLSPQETDNQSRKVIKLAITGNTIKRSVSN